MAETRLDLRDLEPADRHPKIFAAFDKLPSGESLVIVNDHDPQPLFYQFQAEVDSFDAENYTVDKLGENEFVATLPKQ